MTCFLDNAIFSRMLTSINTLFADWHFVLVFTFTFYFWLCVLG